MTAVDPPLTPRDHRHKLRHSLTGFEKLQQPRREKEKGKKRALLTNDFGVDTFTPRLVFREATPTALSPRVDYTQVRRCFCCNNQVATARTKREVWLLFFGLESCFISTTSKRETPSTVEQSEKYRRNRFSSTNQILPWNLFTWSKEFEKNPDWLDARDFALTDKNQTHNEQSLSRRLLLKDQKTKTDNNKDRM